MPLPMPDRRGRIHRPPAHPPIFCGWVCQGGCVSCDLGGAGAAGEGIVLSCDTSSDGARCQSTGQNTRRLLRRRPSQTYHLFGPPQPNLWINPQVNTAIHATLKGMQAFIDSNSPLSEGQVDRQVNDDERRASENRRTNATVQTRPGFDHMFGSPFSHEAVVIWA